jgi:hypothetical protein
MSKDSGQPETMPREFKLGHLGNLNQVIKALGVTIRAMADGTLDSGSVPASATAWASCARASRPRS